MTLSEDYFSQAAKEFTGGEFKKPELPTLGDSVATEVSWTIVDVKRTRNTLLASTDWTQAADSPLSDEKKAEFATYRQALRDITDGELSQIEDFPEAPSA